MQLNLEHLVSSRMTVLVARRLASSSSSSMATLVVVVLVPGEVVAGEVEMPQARSFASGVAKWATSPPSAM